jgi:hypothetical protein
MSSLPTQIAETIQTAHIKRDPSPHHDLNPSTSASVKEPVTISHVQQQHPGGEGEEIGLDEDEDDDDIDDAESEIPISVLRPQARRTSFPPMPDLRFEQSYLNSLRDADTWWRVGWITVRDQVRMDSLASVLSSCPRWGFGLFFFPLPALVLSPGSY